jgi:hypothetical protein
MSVDVWRRAAFHLVVSSALVLSSAALALAVCPTVTIPPTDPPDIVVGSGCRYMLVKMWGNGGNAGNPDPLNFRGRGGGGAALTVVYEVQEGQHFRAVVNPNPSPSQSWMAYATALFEMNPTGPPYRMLVAGAGGAGGNQDGTGERPDGGAGGWLAGKAGVGTTFDGWKLHGGLGGTQSAGGAGGNGKAFNGWAGCAYGDPNGFCGSGPGGGGRGGEGYYGGGGGGVYELYYPISGGGGGGSSEVARHPGLVYWRGFDGNGPTPGNALDPLREDAGEGGLAIGSNYSMGSMGRVVVMFDGLDIDPEATTRWKAQRDDEKAIDIVFESPVELESASLDIKDPDGVDVAVDPQPMEPLSTEPPFRYKLPWKGPWTWQVGQQTQRLPAGNYTVIVRGTPVESGGFELKSEPYERVSLVEVKEIKLEPKTGSFTPNPNVAEGSGSSRRQPCRATSIRMRRSTTR